MLQSGRDDLELAVANDVEAVPGLAGADQVSPAATVTGTRLAAIRSLAASESGANIGDPLDEVELGGRRGGRLVDLEEPSVGREGEHREDRPDDEERRARVRSR